ncbi:MAG: RNA polymerase sigma factor [Actinomycetota bacterium]
MSGARRTGAAKALGRGLPPFQSFVNEHRAMVYRFLLAAVGPSDADDCFQETFLGALRAYPRLRHGENLRGWILTIASRKAIDFARARARRPVPMDEVPHHPAGAVSAADGSDADRLWDAVRRLPPRQGVAVIHRVVLDHSYRTVAQAMGGTVETARANVYQGLKRLREEVR